MSTVSPWGDPEPKRPRFRRPNPIVIVLLLALPLLGYLGGSYLEQHVLTTPKTRLDVAIKALNSGYDRTALMLLQPLAEKGDARAELLLANIYEYGSGTSKDANKAVALYTKAAEQKLVPAEARLGDIYLHGTMVLQDLSKARDWSERAAKAGNIDAQMELADIYERGLGISEDSIDAYAWNAIAAARGNALAASRRDRILRTMSPENQVKAEARANALEALLKTPLPPPPSA
jgi:TPR repeat protein